MKSKLLYYTIIFFLYINSYSQFDEFKAKYDILSTIAGKGELDDSGTSGWLEEYEGAQAIDAELSRPHFAMADSIGNVYIADKESHAIRMVSPNGIITTVAGTNSAGYNGDGPAIETQLSSPNGIWVKPDGTFFILDLGNDKIRKVDNEGNLTTVVDDPSGIFLGRGLWVNENEDLLYYVSGSRVRRWTEEDGIVEYASGFSSPGHIIVDPSGYLVVTDRGANRVYRIINDTTRIVIAGNGNASGGGNGFPATETGLDGIRGIWFLEDQSYLLATHEGSQIWYVDPFGIINLLLDGMDGDEYHSGDGEHFQTPGYKISEARGVSVDYEGNIIITENDLGFIRKISKKNTTSISDKGYTLPEFKLHVYPNPFNASVNFYVNINPQHEFTICLFNIRGQKVWETRNLKSTTEKHIVSWNPVNLPSGVYFAQITSAGFSSAIKIVYLK